MSFPLTERVVKLLCGQAAYERGQACREEKRVAFSGYDDENTRYEATVSGDADYRVALELDSHGDVVADCECPNFHGTERYCEHIAAVLLTIQDMAHSGERPARSHPSLLRQGNAAASPFPATAAETADRVPERRNYRTYLASPRDAEIVAGLLELFEDRPSKPSRALPRFDGRERLQVEFLLRPVVYRQRSLFGLELKVGPKRLFVVQRLREFLDRVEQRRLYPFTRQFSYDPELHCFDPDSDAILQQLLRISRNERLYLEAPGSRSSSASRAGSERLLVLPPDAWEQLQPLLLKAPAVKLEHDGYTAELSILDDPLPIRFSIRRDRDDYLMEAEELERIVVLPDCGLALHGGKGYRLKPEQCLRLAEMKEMLDRRDPELVIPPDRMEPFMERVVPGLMKLGRVQLADEVADRILRMPLKAKLYLDRVRDRLLASLEFQYGEIVVNPLEESAGRRDGRILVRDAEKERAILELMEQSAFAKTESGYFMAEEDGEYEFLRHIVPQLELLLTVYATSAVKARLYVPAEPPQITVTADERIDWLEIKFQLSGIGEADIRSVLQALQEKRRYYRLPGGALMPLQDEAYEEIIRFLNETGLRGTDISGASAKLPVVRALHLMDRSGERGSAIKIDRRFRQLLDNMRNPDNLDFPVPDSLTGVLRDYQTYGYQWMRTLARYGFGGILADDMGLGKTVQTIAFLVSVLPELRGEKRPAVVVAPASLVYNWRNELRRFAPEARVLIADGGRTERGGVLRKLTETDIVLTSYPLLRRDIRLYESLPIHTLILDEAQMFKNHATQTAHAVKALQARYRFALTGTPVENRLEELWSVFDAVFPELFQTRKAFNDLPRETVAKRARPFVLRRLKSDVLKELPEKIESIQASELLPEQKTLYAAYLAELRQETLKHLNEDSLNRNRIKILAGITRLRQLCCHPALFVDGYKGGSAKFEQLLELIEECRDAGKRMLIFSQFTEMLGLIGRELANRDVPFFYLDGSTPARERVELCGRYNEGERDAFLISLKAGGTGLNLTGADTVILYDLWWNPAVERQATDRAHRIGQKKIVQVIRLVAQGTVEDKMYELQQRKIDLIDEVIRSGQDGLPSMTAEEIRELLAIEQP